jgi:RNA polymerase sigma factor (TIGR02999 family)
MAEDRAAHELTQVLNAAADGDSAAAAQVLPLLYDELHRLARARLARTPPGQTLQPTALVHEAYVKLVQHGDPGWRGRQHFFAAAAAAMRQILVDRARRKASVKHGGGAKRTAEEPEIALEQPREDILALHEALTKLENEDPRKAQLVMLRYFAGLSPEETAEATNVSLRTIEREWRYCKAWLRREMRADADSDGATA